MHVSVKRHACRERTDFFVRCGQTPAMAGKLDTDWFEARRRDLNIKQDDIAEAIGRDRSVVSKMLRGKGSSITLDRVPALAQLYRVSQSEILRRAGLRIEEAESSEESLVTIDRAPDQIPVAASSLHAGLLEVGGIEYASIPRYDARLSAGPGALAESNAEPLGFTLYESQWLSALTRASPSHLALVRVDGDSMEPTLFNGDWVLVDRTQRKFSREGIYAMRVGDTLWVKRLSLNLRERLIRIISDNRDKYPMQELSEEDVALVGRIIWIVGRRVE